jgi:hypothetical protein
VRRALDPQNADDVISGDVLVDDALIAFSGEPQRIRTERLGLNG